MPTLGCCVAMTVDCDGGEPDPVLLPTLMRAIKPCYLCAFMSCCSCVFKPCVHVMRVRVQIARWVALVPYLEDGALQKRRVDVWMSAAETLAAGAGDGEEHAHLLAGYFMEIGQQAYVVAGASTYGAKSMFVLTTGKPLADPYAQPVSEDV